MSENAHITFRVTLFFVSIVGLIGLGLHHYRELQLIKTAQENSKASLVQPVIEKTFTTHVIDTSTQGWRSLPDCALITPEQVEQGWACDDWSDESTIHVRLPSYWKGKL